MHGDEPPVEQTQIMLNSTGRDSTDFSSPEKQPGAGLLAGATASPPFGQPTSPPEKTSGTNSVDGATAAANRPHSMMTAAACRIQRAWRRVCSGRKRRQLQASCLTLLAKQARLEGLSATAAGADKKSDADSVLARMRLARKNASNFVQVQRAARAADLVTRHCPISPI
jgi:hypothetical protein